MPPTPIHGDNTASISLVASGVTKRSRHFSIEWFKVKDLIDNGELQVDCIPTDQNVADFFTKRLAREKFTLFRDLLMGNNKLQNHFLPPHAALVAREVTPRVQTCSLQEIQRGRNRIAMRAEVIGEPGPR